MRKWYTYWLDPDCTGKIYVPLDTTYDDHKESMGSYKADNAYKSKIKFFNTYFFNYQQNRSEYYDNFLRKHLKKQGDILSIASGRCANELF